MESTSQSIANAESSESEDDEMAEECSSEEDGMVDVGTCTREKDEMVENLERRESVPYVGMEFISEEQATDFYNAYARSVGFSVRKAAVRKSARGAVLSRRYVCFREGFRAKKHVDRVNRVRQPRSITRVGCQATFRVKKESSGKWVVKDFIEEHNHMVAAPTEVHLLKSKRQVKFFPKGMIDDAKCVGVQTNLNMSLFSQDTGENRNVGGSTEKDCINNSCLVPQKSIEKGDAQAVLDYFGRMQAENPSFFYAIQVDENERMTNFFWADARSRMDYSYFGDVVTFDTTYKTNRYNMSFAPFTGVNHHQQPVLFGCALLLDETESSLVWLFETWMKAMSGRHPVSIITDQDPTIEGAVARVLPQTRHRFYLWHIFQNAAKHLSHVYQIFSDLKMELSKCICMKETIKEFESCWEALLNRYDLRDNMWLQLLYNKREKWVPAYLRNTFFADMATTQRSQSINSFFYGHVNERTTLHEFVKQYERALANRREKENEEDFKTIHTQPILKLSTPMEEEAANIYTRSMFEKFQEELVKCQQYVAEKVEEDGSCYAYKVTRYGKESRTNMVSFNVSEIRASCSCQMFEFVGILCRHILIVFRLTNIMTLPSHYILRRWTRNAKSGFLIGEQGVELRGDSQESVTLRYNDLCHRALILASKGAVTLDAYNVAVRALRLALEEVEAVGKRDSSVSHAATQAIGSIQHDNIGEGSGVVHSNIQKGQSSTGFRPTLEINQRKKRCGICKSYEHDDSHCPMLNGGIGGQPLRYFNRFPNVPLAAPFYPNSPFDIPVAHFQPYRPPGFLGQMPSHFTQESEAPGEQHRSELSSVQACHK